MLCAAGYSALGGLQYAKNAGGWEDAPTYPYTFAKGTCKYSSAKSVFTVPTIYGAPKDMENIKNYLYQYGPMSARVP